MGFINKLEVAAAKKLKSLFLDAKKLADSSIKDLEDAQKNLEEAQRTAAEHTERAHQAAIDAAQKAQDAAAQLMLEVKATEQRKLQYKDLLDKSNK